MLYHSPLTSPTPNTVDFVLDGTKHVLAGFSAANPKICFHVKVRSSRLGSAFAPPSSLAPPSFLSPRDLSLLHRLLHPSTVLSAIFSPRPLRSVTSRSPKCARKSITLPLRTTSSPESLRLACVSRLQTTTASTLRSPPCTSPSRAATLPTPPFCPELSSERERDVEACAHMCDALSCSFSRASSRNRGRRGSRTTSPTRTGSSPPVAGFERPRQVSPPESN